MCNSPCWVTINRYRLLRHTPAHTHLIALMFELPQSFWAVTFSHCSALVSITVRLCRPTTHDMPPWCCLWKHWLGGKNSYFAFLSKSSFAARLVRLHVTCMWACLRALVYLNRQLRVSTARPMKNWTAPPLALPETCLQDFWQQSLITPHHQLLWTGKFWSLWAFQHTHARTHGRKPSMIQLQRKKKHIAQPLGLEQIPLSHARGVCVCVYVYVGKR